MNMKLLAAAFLEDAAAGVKTTSSIWHLHKPDPDWELGPRTIELLCGMIGRWGASYGDPNRLAIVTRQGSRDSLESMIRSGKASYCPVCIERSVGL